jgi:hypothetical protein
MQINLELSDYDRKLLISIRDSLQTLGHLDAEIIEMTEAALEIQKQLIQEQEEKINGEF